jgi:hypothetical protein
MVSMNFHVSSSFFLLYILYIYEADYDLDTQFCIGMLGGMRTPRGIFPARGRDGEKRSPRALAGTGAGNLPPRGDGDGSPFPDGEVPVVIPTV